LDKGFLYFKIWLPHQRVQIVREVKCERWEREGGPEKGGCQEMLTRVAVGETSFHCVLRRDFLNSSRVWVKGFHRKRPSCELMLGWSSVSVAFQTMLSMYFGFGGEAAGVLKLDVLGTVDTVFGQS
jgi:hypothetical protein